MSRSYGNAKGVDEAAKPDAGTARRNWGFDLPYALLALALALAAAPFYGILSPIRLPFHDQIVGSDPFFAWRFALTVLPLVALGWSFRSMRHYLRVGVWRQYVVNVPYVISMLPLAFAVLAFLLFAEAGQMHEIYLVTIENGTRLGFLVGLSLVALLAAAIFTTALRFTRPHADSEYGGTSIPLMPALRFTRYCFALLCGVAPLLGLLWGLRRAQEILTQTVDRAWEATRKVSDSGPLTITGPFETSSLFVLRWESGLLYELLFLAVLSFTVAGAAQLVLYACLGRPRDLPASAGAAAMSAALVVAVVLAVANFPGSASQPDAVKITDLISASKYLLVALLVATSLVLLLLWHFRSSMEALLLVWLACGLVTIFALVLVPLLDDHDVVNLSRAIGPLGMATIQFITIFSLFVGLAHLSRRTGVPFILAIVALIGVRAFMAAGDEPPRIPAGTTQLPGTVPIADLELKNEVEDWLKVRADRRKRFREAGQPFPIFVVAAQGGGIYAANAAAVFLANIEDRCPGFGQHIFAISGVSGGAVGAAGFGAMLRAKPRPADAWCSQVLPGQEAGAELKDASWMATQDHISPVLALLTPEYAEKAFIVSVGSVKRALGLEKPDSPRMTRASALERSLACSFYSRPSLGESRRRMCERKPAENWNLAYASHFAGKPVPALLFNTTFVETGQRVAFSPFPLAGLGDANLTSFDELGGLSDARASITLAQAAVASARFPLLMPAHSLPLAAPRKGHWNFVDGGYSDNSGAATATAVMQALKTLQEKGAMPLAERETVRIVMIVLTSEFGPPKLSEVKGTSLVDTRAPIEALINVRSTLAAREIARARERFKPEEVRVIGLDQSNFALQLGWTLSRTTHLIVSMFVAKPEHCERSRSVSDVDRELLARNACHVRDIIEMLSGPGRPS